MLEPRWDARKPNEDKGFGVGTTLGVELRHAKASLPPRSEHPLSKAVHFGGREKCSAHEHIDDLLRDASRRRAEQLILASKRSWAKWLRSGKDSRKRR